MPTHTREDFPYMGSLPTHGKSSYIWEVFPPDGHGNSSHVLEDFPFMESLPIHGKSSYTWRVFPQDGHGKSSNTMADFPCVGSLPTHAKSSYTCVVCQACFFYPSLHRCACSTRSWSAELRQLATRQARSAKVLPPQEEELHSSGAVAKQSSETGPLAPCTPPSIKQFFKSCRRGPAQPPLDGAGSEASEFDGAVSQGVSLMTAWRNPVLVLDSEEYQSCEPTFVDPESPAAVVAQEIEPPAVTRCPQPPPEIEPPAVPANDNEQSSQAPDAQPVADKLQSELFEELEEGVNAWQSTQLPSDIDKVKHLANPDDLEGIAKFDVCESNQDAFLDQLGKVFASADARWAKTEIDGTGDQKTQDMKAAIDTGVFDMRKSIGQKFYDDHKTGSESHTAYHALKGRDAKRQFRADWAKDTYGNLVLSKTHSQSFRKINKSSGVYRPLGAIIMKEGGWRDPAAVRGSKLLATKCCLMGGQWITRNPLTERLEFFHLRREVSDEMTEAWTKCEQESKNVDTEGQATGRAGGGIATGSGAGLAVEPHRTEGELPSKTPVKKQQKSPCEKTQAHKEPTVFASAARVKGLWLSTLASANTLVSRIHDPASDWQWAKNEMNLGRLQTRTQELDGEQTSFAKDFLIQDLATFKKNLTPERLMTELATFIGMKKFVLGVQKEMDRLIAMHKSSQ